MIRPNDRCWCGSGLKYKRCHLNADGEQRAAPAPAQPVRETRLVTPQGRPCVAPGIVSPARAVPPEIVRPDYALTGRPRRRFGRGESLPMTPEQLARMRRACKAAAEVLAITGSAVKPGVTTEALDAIAHRETIARGAYPSPLNYNGFPKSICTSVNEVVCHGIPDSRPLEEGDIVNVDVTRDCLDVGIAAVRPGQPVSDIGRAIEDLATRQGYGVVRAYCGHGIGEAFHTGVYVPHFFDRSAKAIMRPGMTFTIEPMITIGKFECDQWPDGWTEVTRDRDLTAQFEHTLVVTETGAEILTLP